MPSPTSPRRWRSATRRVSDPPGTAMHASAARPIEAQVRTLHRRTRLTANPVAAVAANLAIPTHPAQPGLQPLRVHKVLDDAEHLAIAQATFDELVPAGDIGLLLAHVDMLVDEQHPPAYDQQTPQQLPELLEPAHRHMGKPRREEDHIKPRRGRPREHVGDLERDLRRPHPRTSDLDHLW